MEKHIHSHEIIELVYNKEKFSNYINENEYNIKTILEKYGVFIDCETLSDQLLKIIKSNNRHNFIFTPKQNVLCKKIKIIFQHIEGIAAGYRYLHSIYNQQTKTFDEISIVVSEFGNLNKAVLMHELQHAYEDLQFYKKGSNISNYLDYYGYTKNQKDDSWSNLEKSLSDTIYCLMPSEINGYLNAMYSETKDNKQKFPTPSDAMKYMKNTKYYKSYDNVLYNLNYIRKEKDESKQKQILSFINSISNLNFKNYHQVKKWAKYKLSELQNKLDSMTLRLIQLCYEKHNNSVHILSLNEFVSNEL